jgi:agmatinase
LFSSPFTFARRETSLEEAEYAFIGIPYDSSESYRVGSRFAPNAIRESSREIEDYDMLEEVDLLSIKIADLGDVDVAYGNYQETLGRIKTVVREVLDRGAVPICVGGEHSITYGILHAYAKHPFVLIYDAHLDFRDDYLGERFSHACVTRRISELLGAENILVVGVRSALREEVRDAEKLGLRFIPYPSCKEKLAEKIEAAVEGRELYLSLDMDVLDPKEARGVCNPEPPGLSYEELLDSLAFLRKANLTGFDLTEVTPLYDSYTQILAAKLIFKVLAKAHEDKGSR